MDLKTALHPTERWPLLESAVLHRSTEPCGAAVFACHHGVDGDAPDHDMGDNRVLAYLSLLAGTSLLRHVDMVDVDDVEFNPGDRVINLYENSALFHVADVLTQVFVVTVHDSYECSVDVALFVDMADAEAHFARHQRFDV
jgi:hypothetical protein